MEDHGLLSRTERPKVIANNLAVRERNRRRTEARALAGDSQIGVVRMRNRDNARLTVPGSGEVIRVGGREFETVEEAARAYDEARVEYGLAPINFLCKNAEDEAAFD